MGRGKIIFWPLYWHLCLHSCLLEPVCFLHCSQSYLFKSIHHISPLIKAPKASHKLGIGSNILIILLTVLNDLALISPLIDSCYPNACGSFSHTGTCQFLTNLGAFVFIISSLFLLELQMIPSDIYVRFSVSLPQRDI